MAVELDIEGTPPARMPQRGEVHVVPGKVHRRYWVPRVKNVDKPRPTLVAWPPDDRPPWATLVEGTSEKASNPKLRKEDWTGQPWVRDDEQRLVTLEVGEAGARRQTWYWFHGDPGHKFGRLAAVKGEVVLAHRLNDRAPELDKVDESRQKDIRIALDSWCEVNSRVHPRLAGWSPYNRQNPAARPRRRRR